MGLQKKSESCQHRKRRPIWKSSEEFISRDYFRLFVLAGLTVPRGNCRGQPVEWLRSGGQGKKWTKVKSESFALIRLLGLLLVCSLYLDVKVGKYAGLASGHLDWIINDKLKKKHFWKEYLFPKKQQPSWLNFAFKIFNSIDRPILRYLL